jgi:hypothetical protein
MGTAAKTRQLKERKKKLIKKEKEKKDNCIKGGAELDH